MKILCTGAAGFVGSHTVDALLTAGHEVHGLDNLKTGKIESLASALDHPKFRFTPSDVTVHYQIRSAIDHVRPDAVIHLAAQVSVAHAEQNPGFTNFLNVAGTRMVAEYCVQFKVPKIVFASSSAVYGNPTDIPIRETTPRFPISVYGQSKMDAEMVLEKISEKTGISVTCLRYFNVFGPRQDRSSEYSGVITKFKECAKRGLIAHICGDGSQTRDFIHVTDVANANALAATNDQEGWHAHNVGTGIETSVLDLAKLCGCKWTHEPERKGDVQRSVCDPTQLKYPVDNSRLIV